MRSTQAHFYFLTQRCFFDFLSEKYDKEKMNFLNDFLCYDMLAANCQNRLVIVYIKIRTVRGRKTFYGRGCVCWFDGACIFVNYIFAR